MSTNPTHPIRTAATPTASPIAMEALLGREPAQLGEEMVRERIQGKVVLVTGAAGSIGSELCRQIAALGPRALVGLEQAETPLFYLERVLRQKFPALKFYPEIGNVTRAADVRWTMERHRPSIVFHAAAYKHVPLMESQWFAAVENNILGAWIVAQASAKFGAEQFVLVSTDKAVRPASVMGATKRVAEMAVRALQQEIGTRFIAVRFGNVLGSSGSVIPIFKEQIAAGGPVTVTHPEMRRYFMTASEAAQLLLESLVLGAGGETFVLDMGEPVGILDLAKNLIRLSGLRADVDIQIEFTGVRPGEKLFEELHTGGQRLAPTAHARILSLQEPAVARGAPGHPKDLRPYLRQFEQALETRDAASLVQILKTLIPDFCPGCDRSSDPFPAEPVPDVIAVGGPDRLHDQQIEANQGERR